MKKSTVLLSTIFAALVSVFSGYAQDMPPTLVVTDQVEEMDFHDQITLVGRTKAAISSRIVAEVSGRVQAVNAEEGTWVGRNEPLVTIDPERARLTLAAKEAEAKGADARAALARKDRELARELFKNKLISERTLDSVEAATTIAIENYNQLQAERDKLNLDFENCSIRAPFGGYTVRKLVDVGEWVSMGTPVYEMVGLSKIKVTVDLPERHFGHVAPGGQVLIHRSGDDENPLTGRMTGIAPDASETTHTFPVIVTVDNKDGRLGGGMLVKATVSLSETFSSLAVSKDALVRQGSQTMIYTVADGKAAPIPVMVTSTNGQMIAVQGEGLVKGMPVVVRGNERIFPGSPVRTADEAPAGSGPTDDAEQAGGS